MTITTPTPMTDTGNDALPAATQRALDNLNSKRSAWQAARQKQQAAGALAATVRQRREETENEAKAMNEECRPLFRENQGAMTPRMKKLRAEIALSRETLNEFDDLLAAHAGENEDLSHETGARAGYYLRARDHLLELHSLHLWEQFMKVHGQTLVRVLGMLKTTLGRRAALATGTVHSVNDPDTVLKGFIEENITRRALACDTLPEDALPLQAGHLPDATAVQDARETLSPAARHKLNKQRERAAREKAQ